MGTQLLEQVVAGEAPGLVPLTVDQYHKMLEAGILRDGDPVELIDGFLVWKDRRDSRGGREMVHGPEHAATVNRLFHAVFEQLIGSDHFAQCQLPIAIYPNHAPEPDVSVVSGRPQDYVEHLPNPNDVRAVFETADSSLRHDRTTKQRLYADAGIPVYVVVDLVARQIEAYTQPLIGQGRYGQTQVFKSGDMVRLELAGGRVLELPVSEILP